MAACSGCVVRISCSLLGRRPAGCLPCAWLQALVSLLNNDMEATWPAWTRWASRFLHACIHGPIQHALQPGRAGPMECLRAQAQACLITPAGRGAWQACGGDWEQHGTVNCRGRLQQTRSASRWAWAVHLTCFPPSDPPDWQNCPGKQLTQSRPPSNCPIRQLDTEAAAEEILAFIESRVVALTPAGQGKARPSRASYLCRFLESLCFSGGCSCRVYRGLEPQTKSWAHAAEMRRATNSMAA